MNEEKYLQLAADVDLRRESFGCISYRKSIGKVYQFNIDGYLLLKEFLVPSTIKEVMTSFKKNNTGFDADQVFEFYLHCFEQGILEFVPVGNKSKELIGGDWISERHDCLKIPFASTIYITDLCPKACRHCITRSSPKASTLNDLTTNQWMQAFDTLRAAGVMQVIITGGDPFTRQDIFEILEYADKLGFYISLLTDYDDLNEEHLERIRSIKNIRYLQTSLDGATAATHDFIRGKGSFVKTMKRLELLSNYKMNHTISTSVFKTNLEELYDIAAISKRFNAECLYLNPIAPYGRATRFPEELLLTDDDLRKLAMIYFDLIDHHGIDAGNSYWMEQVSNGIENFDPAKPFAGVLDAVTIATTLCSINSMGDIYLDSKLKSEKILRLGNILKDGIIGPWNSEVLNGLRNHFQEGVPLKLVHINEAIKSETFKS